MFHIIGVTPEAPTREKAFGGEKPEETVTIEKKEIEKRYGELNTATSPEVDSVIFGCPHATLQEIKEIAQMLKHEKVHKGVRLWIGTCIFRKDLASRMGLVKVIEEAGGLVLSDLCTHETKYFQKARYGDRDLDKALGETIATNSLIIAGGQGKLRDVWFGNVRDCVNAAIKGKWVGE